MLAFSPEPISTPAREDHEISFSCTLAVKGAGGMQARALAQVAVMPFV